MTTNNKPRYGAGAVLPDGTIADLIFDRNANRTAFAVSAPGGSPSISEGLTLPTGEKLQSLPASNNLLQHGAVLLPDRHEDFGTVAELVAAIRLHIDRYVDLSPNFLGIATAYVLLSWVYDAFNELPYLRFRGEPGSGKTRALIVVGSLCYRPFLASGASTVSPIFHTLDTFRGSLILDEADFRFSDERAELVKIFNNGNVRGFPVLRTAVNQNRGIFDPRAFWVYGPKIVAMRDAFKDRALESRFITEEMGQRPMRPDIPLNLPDIQAEEGQALRNQLLAYRLATRADISIDPDLADPRLSPRLNQILVPLLSVVDDESVREHIVAAALGVDQALRLERGATAEAKLLEVLTELLADIEHPHVTVGVITDTMVARFGAELGRPITPRLVGSVLRTRLRLLSYKTHGIFVVPVTEKAKVDALCPRYGVTPFAPDERPHVPTSTKVAL